MSHTLFISDLHLSEDRPDITQALLLFCKQNINKETDALYILGDLFEYWIGDDDNSPFNLQIIQLLNNISKTTPVYFIHGNRDFAIGERFAKAANVTVLPELKVIDLYGTPTLILHGDSLCTMDLEFMKFRAKSRKKWWQTMMLALPLWYRRHYANKSRKRSKQSQMNKAEEIMDVTPYEVVNQMALHDVNLMIHGHTHRPDIHTIEQADNNKTRIVLGDWYSQGSYLVVDETGFNLMTIPRRQS